jgi:CBS domain-containing protein
VATLTTVEEVMSTELIAVNPSANLMEAAGAMSAGGAGSVLVIQDGALVGIFTERDILRALGYSSSADLARVSSVSKWMSRDPMTIGPDTTVAEALNRMLFGGFRHLPVMDGDAVVGMVSMRDLARSIAEHWALAAPETSWTGYRSGEATERPRLWSPSRRKGSNCSESSMGPSGRQTVTSTTRDGATFSPPAGPDDGAE